MSTQPPAKSRPPSAKLPRPAAAPNRPPRQEALAEALRENLHRRKAQRAARAGTSGNARAPGTDAD